MGPVPKNCTACAVLMVALAVASLVFSAWVVGGLFAMLINYFPQNALRGIASL
jgi:hypothetical protein